MKRSGREDHIAGVSGAVMKNKTSPLPDPFRIPGHCQLWFSGSSPYSMRVLFIAPQLDSFTATSPPGGMQGAHPPHPPGGHGSL